MSLCKTLLASLLVSAVLLIGCAESTMLPPASVANATSGTIRGVVKIGGAARAGVEVSLEGPGAPPLKRFTNAGGEVTFVDLPFGDYTVTVRSPTTGRTMGNPVKVSQTQASASVDFDLGR